MAKNSYISGIGGWLGFLIVVLMIISPLSDYNILANGFREASQKSSVLTSTQQWQYYKQASWLIFAISAAIKYSAGYRLWKTHQPESVSFAILALWLSFPIAYIASSISEVLIFNLNINDALISGMYIGATIQILIAGFWTAYLMRSVRVKNTYKLS